GGHAIHVRAEQEQLGNQVGLLNDDALQTLRLFCAYRVDCELLQLQKCLSTWQVALACCAQIVKRCFTYGLRRRVLLSQVQSGWAIRVIIDLREFGKEFVGNRCELVLSLCRLSHQLQAMPNEA